MKNRHLSALIVIACIILYTKRGNAQSSINSSNQSGSSSNNNRFFTAWGFSPLLAYEQAPTSTYVTYLPTYNANYLTATPISVNVGTYDIFTFIFRARYNLKELNNNNSISISSLPALGLGLVVINNAVGVASLNIPLFIEYNSGNVSTNSSDKDNGIVFGVGAEWMNAPLVAGQYPITNKNDQPVYTPINGNWFEPAIEFGYRYWNKRNKAKEFNIKAGAGTAGSFSVRLSWLKCIGY